MSVSLFLKDAFEEFEKANPGEEAQGSTNGPCETVLFEISGNGNVEELRTLAKQVFEKYLESRANWARDSYIFENPEEDFEGTVFFGKTPKDGPKASDENAAKFLYGINPDCLYMVLEENEGIFPIKKLDMPGWTLSHFNGDEDVIGDPFYYLFPNEEALTEYGYEIRNAIERLGFKVRLAVTNSDADDVVGTVYH